MIKYNSVNKAIRVPILVDCLGVLLDVSIYTPDPILFIILSL